MHVMRTSRFHRAADMACIFIARTHTLANLLADLLYAYLDPRVRYR